MKDRDLDEVTLTIRIPRYIRDSFKRDVKENPVKETSINDALTSYMIKAIGDYNKHVRLASKEI